MANRIYQVTTYRAKQLQALRNVKVHSPCIVQILSGSKRLFYKNSSMDLSPSTLLLCSASSSLSFENLPQNGHFQSRVFSIHCLPEAHMLENSKTYGQHQIGPPVLASSKSIAITLDALNAFDSANISEATQTYWLMGLYQQLAELGALHHLFPEHTVSFSHQLAKYLADSPAEEHSLESVAANFATSRATLIRRLKQENIRYRDLLAEVRLNHALSLIQSGIIDLTMLSDMCGYKSESRFSQRFHGKFGVTPKQYIRSLTS